MPYPELSMSTGRLTMYMPYQYLRQSLVDVLARSMPLDHLNNQLPDELVVLILKHMLTEPRQPVKRPLPLMNSHVIEDPCARMLSQVFAGCVLNEKLIDISREAYFQANTMGIDAPVALSPQQLFFSAPFSQTWSPEVRSLELRVTYSAQAKGAWWYSTRFDEMARINKLYWAEQDIGGLVGILQQLKKPFPKLRRLILVLTIRPCWEGDSVTNGPPLTKKGSICSAVLGEQALFAACLTSRIVPALKTLDLSFAALKWPVTCGHMGCVELADSLLCEAKALRIMRGARYFTAVLSERKMPRWA